MAECKVLVMIIGVSGGVLVWLGSRIEGLEGWLGHFGCRKDKRSVMLRCRRYEQRFWLLCEGELWFSLFLVEHAGKETAGGKV